MVTRVILIRHCESVGNLTKTFQGNIDCDISETGKRQLDALAERMKNVDIDVIYSGPLMRAVKTAEAVNRYKNCDIIINDDINEINAGVLGGVSYAEMPIKYPYEAECWTSHPEDFAPECGESMRRVNERAWRGICDIVSANVGKKICVVSHGCAIRNIICRANGLPIEKLGSVNWCDNTALSVIDFDSCMNPTVICENDSSHLSSELYISCADMVSVKNNLK